MQQQITPGFKGFGSDLKCRDMQYAIGEIAEMPENKNLTCCPEKSNEGGLHFCENPLDVLGYYPPTDSRFAEVEGHGEAKKSGSDSKIAVKKLHIKAEITLNGLLKAGVKFILDRVKWDESPATNTGDRSAATNTGDSSAATNTGDRSAATNTGYSSAATNTGYRSAATNTGYSSAATNTGDRSAATVEGKESVAISIGIEGKAKGIVGCWIVLSEWKEDENREWHRINVKSFKVDGKKIKENTFYLLKDGKPVETE